MKSRPSLESFCLLTLGNFILFDTTLNIKQPENCLPKSEQFWLLTSFLSLLK